jgi:hypothetical protein
MEKKDGEGWFVGWRTTVNEKMRPEQAMDADQ